MISSAQISVYPLRQEHLGPTIDSVRHALQAHGLRAEVGPMSTMVTGEVVMTFTMSNACPVPR